MKIFFLVWLILATLLALFIIWYSWELSAGGNFTLQNILTGRLPEDYITGEGSTFNAIQFAIWGEGLLALILVIGLFMKLSDLKKKF